MSDLEIKKKYGLFDNPLNKKLISDLQRSGEDVLVFPPVKTVKLELTETAAVHLQNLNGFDWVILTDVFAADYFIEALSSLAVDFFELDNLTICALGEAVADRLRFVQVHADVIPSKISDEAIFSAISNYAAFELEDSSFLVTGEESASLPFIDKLKAEKASVEELSIYKAEFSDESANTKLKTLLMGGAVDEFVFSAPEDLLSLKFLTGEKDLTALFNESQVSAVSEIVFQTLQENGFRPLYFHYK
jgi:uroporphyrinogen-III synthase